MKTNADIRRQNLERLIKEAGTIEALASKADAHPVYISQIRTAAIDQKTGQPRKMGAALARKLEAAMGKPTGWMDADAANMTLAELLTAALKYRRGIAAPGERVDETTLATVCGVAQGAVEKWLAGEVLKMDSDTLASAARYLGVSTAWLSGDGAYQIPARQGLTVNEPFKPYTSSRNARRSGWQLANADDNPPAEFYEIEYLEARGSCGGGHCNMEHPGRGVLVKEASWFQRYQIRPQDALVLFADGDSMADFIVDGDMVIFDRTKTAPVSGKIFLIRHPDGERIKRLRRDVTGNWVLETLNNDKHMYPDELIPNTHPDLLHILGQFVYRQGGG